MRHHKFFRNIAATFAASATATTRAGALADNAGSNAGGAPRRIGRASRRWLAAAAALAGFRITVLDDRGKYATPERFPDAEIVLVEDWEAALGELALTSSSYVFVATQRPASDRACLKRAARSPARYIGMLGSLTKTNILFEALRAEGLDEAALGRIFVPAGLDVGSESPEEIAASVVPELVAARKNLDVRKLRDAVRQAKSSM